MENLDINAVNKKLDYETILKYLKLKSINEKHIDYLLYNLLFLLTTNYEFNKKENFSDFLIENNFSKISKRFFEIYCSSFRTSYNGPVAEQLYSFTNL